MIFVIKDGVLISKESVISMIKVICIIVFVWVKNILMMILCFCDLYILLILLCYGFRVDLLICLNVRFWFFDFGIFGF